MEHPRCSDADLAGGLNHLDGGVGATWRLGWVTRWPYLVHVARRLQSSTLERGLVGHVENK